MPPCVSACGDGSDRDPEFWLSILVPLAIGGPTGVAAYYADSATESVVGTHLGLRRPDGLLGNRGARHTGYEADVKRPITSRMHAMLDYPLAVVLIASPWIFGFSDVGGAAVAIPITIGALALGQSLITDWDLSVARIVPLPIHLALDALAGIVLAISPFVFGFSDEGTNAWLPLVVFGVGMLSAGLLTQRSPETPPAARRTTSPGTTPDG
jgi:hypothetical protein